MNQEPSRAVDKRRLVLFALLSIGASLWGGWHFRTQQSEKAASSQARAGATRVVSLSPGVTDTIITLGAGDQLVAVSDYCKLPGERKITRAGTALTPNYEVIASLEPSAIITSEVKGAQLAPLEKLAPTHRLPWLNLKEWTSSITTLGQLIDQPESASRLVAQIEETLQVEPAEDAPSVLLSLDYGSTGSEEIWYIRRNSIHGAVLRAAGGKNAIERDITGHPKLSPEQLLELDPEAIVVLASDPKRTRTDAQAHFGRWSPLQAVKKQRIGVVSLPEALNVGPSVLELVPLLKAELDALFSLPR